MGEPGIIERYVNCETGIIDDFRIIDVRTLIDGDNTLSEYLLNILRVTIPPNLISCNYKDVVTAIVRVFELTNLC